MKYESDLPRHEREYLQNILLRGEEIRWTGRPKPFYFRKGSAALLGFGIAWLVFNLFFAAVVLSSSDAVPLPALAILVPFILIGIAFIASPWATYRKSCKSFYALTDKRALVVQAKLFSGYEVHPFRLTPDIIKERMSRKDGYGDLIFGYEEAYQQNDRPVMRGVGFINVPDLKHVEELIYQLVEGPKTADDTE